MKKIKKILIKKICAGFLGFVLVTSAVNPIKLRGNEEKSIRIWDYGDIKKEQNTETRVIITLKDKPLVEEKLYKKYDSSKEFLNSDEGKNKRNALKKNRDMAIDEVESLCDDLKVEHSYEMLLNGFSAVVKEEEIEEIKNLSEVSDVYICEVYEALENESETETESESESETESESESESESETETDPIDEREINSLDIAKEFTGANYANKKGYTGKGTTVAILDTSFDVEHEAFAGEITGAKETKESLKKKINDTDISVNIERAYVSEKIPFAYDYSDDDYYLHDPSSNHGSHVAGIAGGNGGEIEGVAPDCQLMLCKIFSDGVGGAYDSDIVAALEDMVKLDVDSINLSIGSPFGEEKTSSYLGQIVYARIKSTGIFVAAAAGNSGSVGSNYSAKEGKSFTVNPDIGTINSPGSYRETFSVANAYIKANTLEEVAKEDVRISASSSYGVTPKMDIAPDITTPGSSIYSAVPGNGYALMGGTSMATPHMAGAMGVIKEYLKSEGIDDNLTNTAENLAMSTAYIMQDENGNNYSPRRQGAGALDLEAAIKSNAYLVKSGGDLAKCSLGSDQDGVFNIEFDLKRMANDVDMEEISYDIKVEAQTERTYLDEGITYIEGPVRPLSVEENEIEVYGNEKIVIGADDVTANGDITLLLTDDLKEELNLSFPNGIFIEGFVELTPTYEGGVELSIPFVGFYGNFNTLPCFDSTIYDDKPCQIREGFMLEHTGSVNQSIYANDEEYRRLGVNIFDKKAKKASMKRAGINTINSDMDYFYIAEVPMRNLSVLSMDIYSLDNDGDIKENVYNHSQRNLRKFAYTKGSNGYGDSVINCGYGWDEKVDDKNAPEGDYLLRISGTFAGSALGEGDVLDEYFYVDNTKPYIESSSIDLTVGTLNLTLMDNYYLQYMVIGDKKIKEKTTVSTNEDSENGTGEITEKSSEDRSEIITESSFEDTTREETSEIIDDKIEFEEVDLNSFSIKDSRIDSYVFYDDEAGMAKEVEVSFQGKIKNFANPYLILCDYANNYIVINDLNAYLEKLSNGKDVTKENHGINDNGNSEEETETELESEVVSESEVASESEESISESVYESIVDNPTVESSNEIKDDHYDGASVSGGEYAVETESDHFYTDDSENNKKGKILYDKKYYYEIQTPAKGKDLGTVKVIGQRKYDIKTIKIATKVKLSGYYYKVTKIEQNAFAGNDKIGKVYVGKNVKFIGKDAFKRCGRLKSVVINSEVLKKIGKNAFGDCRKLKKVIIKSKVLSGIGKNAFGKRRFIIRVPKKKIKKYKKLLRKTGNKKFKIKRC